MDALTTRLVLLFAGLTVLAAMGGGIALAFYDRTLPDALIALGSGALGLLSGAALDTRGRQDVRVVNAPGDPVPVEDAGHTTPQTVLVLAFATALGIVLASLLFRYTAL